MYKIVIKCHFPECILVPGPTYAEAVVPTMWILRLSKIISGRWTRHHTINFTLKIVVSLRILTLEILKSLNHVDSDPDSPS
jgi:hypothetical protein